MSSSNDVARLIVHVVCGLYGKGLSPPPAQAKLDATSDQALRVVPAKTATVEFHDGRTFLREDWDNPTRLYFEHRSWAFLSILAYF